MITVETNVITVCHQEVLPRTGLHAMGLTSLQITTLLEVQGCPPSIPSADHTARGIGRPSHPPADHIVGGTRLPSLPPSLQLTTLLEAKGHILAN